MLWTVLLSACLCRPALADCLGSVWADPWSAGLTYDTVFPNWTKAPVAAFGLWEYDDAWSAWCPASSITGITIFNYGTASGGAAGDITAVYFQLQCGTSTQSGYRTLTYAGVWTVASTNYPAWTWVGPLPYGGDTCVLPTAGCSCFPTLFLYTDIAPCPTPGAVVDLGPGFAASYSAAGITDDCGCAEPWSEMKSEAAKTISYIMTQGDRDEVSPGDTVTYTVFAGRAGSAAYASLVILDSIPAYTHFVMGSANPAPDMGWDPDLGPPPRLRWTLAGGNPAGGATVQVVFKVTVDWGNLDSFEPGSGDAGAPELGRLLNGAAASWIGGGCAGVAAIGPPTRTVVRRFLFWKLGSNDLLMAGRTGQPDDEETYEIFIKNVSTSKTWWNVEIWDTVPAGVDVWSPGYGFDDPCTGWTMTPTGCAAANPARIVTGAKNTILTWSLNLSPLQTELLRWRARLQPTVTAGSTVLNRVSVQEMGRSGIVGGTGNSQVPSNFTHQAIVVLRTTYYSYTSYAASGDQRGCPGFFITFFPLNMNTNFELRKLEYLGGAGVATTGGKSASITGFVGTCVGGFADAGLSRPGCLIERAPAMYWPDPYQANICPAYPFNFLYKVTSNTPFLWVIMSEISAEQMDAHTFAPATNLTYRGFMHYMTFRPDQTNLAVDGYGDRMAIINTSMNAYGVFDPALATMVHIFVWNQPARGWDFVKSGAIDPESIWMPFEGTKGVTVDDVFHYRVISSDAQNIVYQGCGTWGAPAVGGSFDNDGSIATNSQNGYLVASGPGAKYYFICHPGARTPNVVIGNTGPTAATYRIFKYVPISAAVPGPNWPPTLAGSSGTWKPSGADIVPAGLVAGNPHMYGAGFDTTMVTADKTAVGWKVELDSGGPLQIHFGAAIYDTWSGASTIHDGTGKPSGSDFWFFQGPGTDGWKCGCENPDTYCINVFAPKTGMAVGMNATGGWSATYTTDGPDQAVVWLPLTRVAGSNTRAYHMTLRPAGSQGQCVAQYFQCTFDEKFLSAPFIETGVHYEVIAPPVAFSGQPFWITVIVVDNGGGTKTDYCGTTSFTSTDSKAMTAGSAMDAYNYTWDSSDAVATCKGAGCTGACDNGVAIFVNVILTKLGIQTIIAADTMDGSVLGLAAVNVVGADVKLFKEPRIMVAASGDTVRFSICWSNYSSASAFTFVITDALPVGSVFVPEASSNALSCGNTAGVGLGVAYSTLTSASMPGAGSFTTANPVAGTRWLRWTVPYAGVNTTGCACFRATIN